VTSGLAAPDGPAWSIAVIGLGGAGTSTKRLPSALNCTRLMPYAYVPSDACSWPVRASAACNEYARRTLPSAIEMSEARVTIRRPSGLRPMTLEPNELDIDVDVEVEVGVGVALGPAAKVITSRPDVTSQS